MAGVNHFTMNEVERIVGERRGRLSDFIGATSFDPLAVGLSDQVVPEAFDACLPPGGGGVRYRRPRT